MKDQMLIIGGTGKTGRKVVESLKNQGYPVRIGSRSASPSFDWNSPETWDAVLEGVDKSNPLLDTCKTSNRNLLNLQISQPESSMLSPSNKTVIQQ